MIPYKQLSLADIFQDCQNKFDNDKPAFLSLLETHIDIDEFIPISFRNHFYAPTGISVMPSNLASLPTVLESSGISLFITKTLWLPILTLPLKRNLSGLVLKNRTTRLTKMGKKIEHIEYFPICSASILNFSLYNMNLSSCSILIKILF